MIDLSDLSREDFIKDIKRRSPLELQALFSVDDIGFFNDDTIKLKCYLGDVNIGYSIFDLDHKKKTIDWLHYYPLENYQELRRSGEDSESTKKVNSLHLGVLAHCSYVNILEPHAQKYKIGHVTGVLPSRMKQLEKMKLPVFGLIPFSRFAKKSYVFGNKKGFVF